jgi:hypothetical protein
MEVASMALAESNWARIVQKIRCPESAVCNRQKDNIIEALKEENGFASSTQETTANRLGVLIIHGNREVFSKVVFCLEYARRRPELAKRHLQQSMDLPLQSQLRPACFRQISLISVVYGLATRDSLMVMVASVSEAKHEIPYI